MPLAIRTVRAAKLRLDSGGGEGRILHSAGQRVTGWWWQGENARLASLAAAAILGGRLVYPANNGWGTDERLASFASRQIA